MIRPRLFLLIAVLLSIGPLQLDAQVTGTLRVPTIVKIDGKNMPLVRKRFYLFSGTLKDNQALVDRLKQAQIKSRDCFYSGIGVSAPFICWLQTHSCESPMCGGITMDDVAKVPEFGVAYKTGLTAYKNQPNIALDWLVTNMPPTLVAGFYNDRKTLTNTLLGGMVPVQSTQTDPKGGAALFIDVPLTLAAGAKTQSFLVSNVVPIEINGKAYTWACEAAIDPASKVPQQYSPLTDKGSTGKKCEVIIKDLEVCKVKEGCPAK